MATLKCPKCGSDVPAGGGWARAAVSLLVAAPAVPDMASQVRCPQCGHRFADGDISHLRAGSAGRTSRWLAAAALAFAAWAVYRWFAR